MNTHSSKHPPEAARRSWILSGVSMMLAGILLFATVTLSAIGIVLMVIGLGVIMAAYIRSEP